MPSFKYEEPGRDEELDRVLPKKTIIERLLMPVLRKVMIIPLMHALMMRTTKIDHT